MNAQLHNSDDRSGRVGTKSVIQHGNTDKHYAQMLTDALEEVKIAREANVLTPDQEREYWRQWIKIHARSHKSKKQTQWIEPYFSAGQNPDISNSPTELLAPAPLQETGSIDRAHMADLETIVEDWQSFAGRTGLKALSCVPVTCARMPLITKKLSVPLPGPLEVPPTHHNYYESDCALRPLVETGVDLYIRDYGCKPTLIEISTAARSILPVIADWEEGYICQDERIPIVGNPQLAINAVRCWGNQTS